MADTTTSETTSSAPSASDATSLGRMLRDAWQLPVLLLAMGAIVAALWYARQNRAENEWNATLAQASEQIAKNELAIARTILDEVIAPHLAEAPSGFAGRFEAVLADLGAAELPKNATQQSFDAVAKQYEKAIELKATLDEEQFARYSRMLAGAQRDSEAVAAAELAGDEAHAQELASGFGRRRLQAAYDALGQAGHPAEATRAIAAFFKEYEDFRAAQRMRAEDRAWAAALAARARMNHGHADAATERLLLEIRRAEAAASVGDAVEDATFAELCALLGECLRREGKHADAVRELDRARTLAKPSSELEGEIDLSRGLALLSLGDHAAASAVFDRAVLTEHPPAIKSQLVLGRARARASLGQREDALRDFDSIVALAEKGRISSALADECLSVLNELARSAIGEDKNVDAIDYAARAVALGDRGAAGAMAEQLLGEAAYAEAQRMRAAETDRAGSASAIEPGARAEINRMFRRSGEHFAAFLRAEAAKDLPATARSELHFSAGDSFDCAGQPTEALAHFETSLSLLPVGDSKRTERLLRIGDIHAQAHDFERAREAYEGVYRITSNDPRVAMPLVRVYVAAGDEPRALAELRRILEGNAGLAPDSEQYREALDLTARLSFKRGDFTASAERLNELVERDPSNGAVGERLFRLGQSLQEVARLATAESKSGALTTARRQQLERASVERAVEAQRAFQRAIESFETRGRALDGLGRDMLRNAYLQRAHCAFDRGQFKEAIDFYETVDRKYPEEAASVLALVQIVNAADSLGDAQRAEAAHTRALRRIESLPDDALLGDGGVFSRDDWRDWLKNHPPGSRRIAGTGDGKEPNP